jgi:hypothetical protein
MASRSARRRLWTLAVFIFASLTYALPAAAQGINVVNEKSLPRLDKDNNEIKKRRLELKPEAVNFQDCVEDQRIKFTLQLGLEILVPNSLIEVWAANSGVDCGQAVNRTSATKQCWPAADSAVPLQQTVDVPIPVRKIMSGAAPASAGQPVAEQCGKVDLTSIVVQFLYFKPGDRANAAFKKDIPVEVDTVGPQPPSGITLKPGNTRIWVSWDNISGEGGVTALTGVRAYCDLATASGETTVQEDATVEQQCREAGAGEDGGDGGQICENVEVEGGTRVVPASQCASPNFVKDDGTGIVPDNDFNAKYECGNFVGATGTTLKAEAVGGAPLENYKQYAVAVAATDAYGNVGVLSGTQCMTPEETTDFWEAYRAAGGTAGGGFCATSSVGAPAGSVVLLALIVAIAGSSIRRRWRERR